MNNFEENRGWVKGLSMWPNLIPGDVLSTEIIPAYDLRPEMIAVLPGSEVSEAVVHRVTGIRCFPGKVIIDSAGDRSGIDHSRTELNRNCRVLVVRGVLRRGKYKRVRKFIVPPELSPMFLVRLYCAVVRRFFW